MFTDSFRIERVDHSENNPGEDRIQTIGLVGKVLFVVYTERKEACRLISVRIANKKESRLYYGNCKENSSDWGSTYQISFKRGRRNCKKKIVYDFDSPKLESWMLHDFKPASSEYYKPKKVQITLKLDADVVAAFKSTGKGHQTKINDVLRKAIFE